MKQLIKELNELRELFDTEHAQFFDEFLKRWNDKEFREEVDFLETEARVNKFLTPEKTNELLALMSKPSFTDEELMNMIVFSEHVMYSIYDEGIDGDDFNGVTADEMEKLQSKITAFRDWHKKNKTLDKLESV